MQKNNRTIAKNSLYLYLRTFFSIVVSLYTSRVFLEALGVKDFGIYNLVGGVVAFFSVLQSLLANSIQRFLNIEIGRKNKQQENKIFDISIVINIGIVIVFVLLAETIGLWLLNSYLNIPEGKVFTAHIVYQVTILTTVFTLLTIPYTAYVIAHECMSLFAWVTIIQVVAKLLITIALYLVSDRLVIYSIGILLLYLLSYIGYWLYCKYKIGMLPFTYHTVRGNREYKELLSFSLWVLTGNGASVARDQGVSVIFNIFHGIVINAAMGIGNQVSNVYSSLFSNLQTAFLPQIVQNCADDKDRFRTLVITCSLVSILLMSFVCLPLIINADFVLYLWLGDNVPEYTSLFVKIIMVKVLIVCVSQTVYQSLVAKGKIREIQLWFVVLSLLTLALTWVLLFLGTHPSVALFVVTSMDFVMLCLRIHYMSKYTGINAIGYIKSVSRPFILIIFIMLPLSFYLSLLLPSGWLTLIATTIALTLLNAFVAYFSLPNTMRSNIINTIKSRF